MNGVTFRQLTIETNICTCLRGGSEETSTNEISRKDGRGLRPNMALLCRNASYWWISRILSAPHQTTKVRVQLVALDQVPQKGGASATV